MVVMNVHTILNSTLPQWKTLDYSDAEMSLMLLYMLGEALPVSSIAAVDSDLFFVHLNTFAIVIMLNGVHIDICCIPFFFFFFIQHQIKAEYAINFLFLQY